MVTIYKSHDSKENIYKLYNSQLLKLNIPFKDLYVDTSFGSTHIVETGNLSGKPVLLFHGWNLISSYNLILNSFLLKDFHVFAVDTIGYVGKSSEEKLYLDNYDYGKWASDVISSLGFEHIICFGVSFGGGIVAKAMCVSPEKIEKSILICPLAICNGPWYKLIRMHISLAEYKLSKENYWLFKYMLPMTIYEDNIDTELFETVKCIVDNVNIKMGLFTNVHSEEMKKCMTPTLLYLGKFDVISPLSLVNKRANEIIPNCDIHILKDRGHFNFLTEKEKIKIIEFML